MYDKVFQCKADVIRCFLDLHNGLIRCDVKTDDQPVTLTAEPICLIGGTLVAVYQLYFVVIGAVLRDGKKGDVLI